MTQQNLRASKNQVRLKGTIYLEPEFSHKVHNVDFNRFILKVGQNLLPCTASGDMMPIDRIQVGQEVRLHGEIRTFNSWDIELKQETIKATLYVQRFTHVDPFDDSDSFDSDDNIVHIKGTVKEKSFVCAKSNQTLFTLRVNRSANKDDLIEVKVKGQNPKITKDQELELKGKWTSVHTPLTMEEGVVKVQHVVEAKILNG